MNVLIILLLQTKQNKRAQILPVHGIYIPQQKFLMLEWFYKKTQQSPNT